MRSGNQPGKHSWLTHACVSEFYKQKWNYHRCELLYCVGSYQSMITGSYDVDYSTSTGSLWILIKKEEVQFENVFRVWLLVLHLWHFVHLFIDYLVFFFFESSSLTLFGTFAWICTMTFFHESKLTSIFIFLLSFLLLVSLVII